MIDIVIPYRLSPRTNNLELKYCLRGIEKHIQDAGQVWIIGDFPANWMHPYASVIPLIETNWYEHLTRNIHYKLMEACKSPVISDPFLYMNDDHFIMRDMYAADMPYYHSGTHWSKGTGKYYITVANTFNKFPGAYNFDVHTPILIYKERYFSTVGALNWKTPFGFCIKSSYAYGIEGEFYSDYKLDQQPTKEDFRAMFSREMFSIGDKAFTPDMIKFLETLYPQKSRYEI